MGDSQWPVASGQGPVGDSQWPVVSGQLPVGGPSPRPSPSGRGSIANCELRIANWGLRIAVLCVLCACAGCAAIEGGQARTSESSVVVRGRGMEIEVRGEEASTTQPSASGLGKLAMGASEAGTLGSVSLSGIKRNWLLGLAVLGVYAALAAGCWLLRWPVRCALCAVLGVVGLLWPIPAIIAGAMLLGIVIYRQSAVTQQLVRGVDEGLSVLSATDRVAVKLRLAGEQDETAKAAVRAARRK